MLNNIFFINIIHKNMKTNNKPLSTNCKNFFDNFTKCVNGKKIFLGN